MSKNKNLVDIIELYKSENGRSFYEQMQDEIKKQLAECKKYAPHYFTDEVVDQYVELYPNIIKEDIENGKINLEDYINNKNKNIENLIFDLTNDTEKNCCNILANLYFENIGNGDKIKGQEYFNKLFLANSNNYNKYYKKCDEFRIFCDSMSDENKKYFKKLRNWDISELSSFYKWTFIIAFFFISVPYILIKKFALKSKNIQTLKEFMKSNETREMFIILSKGDLY